MTTKHIAYQHKENQTLNHFDILYAKNHMWNSRGIDALRHADVNPFHVCIQDRTKDSPVAVYYLQDVITGEELYWFEDEYPLAFETFRERIATGNHHFVRLFVSVLKQKGSAKETFVHHNPFESEHGKVLQWSDKYNSWQY